MATAKDRQALKQWEANLKFLRENTQINPHETAEDKAERIARAKKDYAYFKEYYFPKFAEAQTPAWMVKNANLIRKNFKIFLWLMWGRGLAKSVEACLIIPLWLWINNDIGFMLLIGQNEDKAKILLDDIKMQFEGNQRLINDYGAQQNAGHWEEGFFITKNGFVAKAIGMGQEPRGLRVGAKRPDYIACDDWETKETQKNPKRQKEFASWLVRSIIPTMDGDRERVLLAQNKFSPRMIFDFIIEENEGWRVNEQKAFDPVTQLPTWREKYPDNYYKDRIKVMGIIAAQSEYNNEPHIEGSYFKNEYIQWHRQHRLDSYDAIVGTWDVAYGGTKTSDFNAVRVWGLKDGRKTLLDCFVKQSKIVMALRWIASYQKSLPKTVRVPFRFEAQFWNDEIRRIIAEVEKEYGILLNLTKADRRTGKKLDHMMTMLPQYENGRVGYSEKLKDHNDTKIGIAQLLGLEPGYKGHDDAPDADVEAFDWLDTYANVGRITPRFTRRTNHSY